MPEMTFTVRWPDGRVDPCYSPSLVAHDHLDVGATYTVAEFVDRSTTLLALASDRVRARYGFACSASAASQERIATTAGAYAPDDTVEIVSMEPPLPGGPS